MLGLGAAALAVLGVTVLMLRQDIRRWRRMQGVDQVLASDFFIKDHALEGQRSVAQARCATKRFIQSLPKKAPSEVEVIGYLSEVRFQCSDDPKSTVFSVTLNH